MKPNELMKVSITDINWDIDEGEEKPDNLDSNMNVTFTPADLIECLEKGDRDYIVNDNLLSEFLGDYISDTTGFCHNGFNYTYKIV